MNFLKFPCEEEKNQKLILCLVFTEISGQLQNMTRNQLSMNTTEPMEHFSMHWFIYKYTFYLRKKHFLVAIKTKKGQISFVYQV